MLRFFQRLEFTICGWTSFWNDQNVFSPFPNDKFQTLPNQRSLKTTILSLMKIAKSYPKGLKSLWENEKLLVLSNFSFSHRVFQRLLLQTRKNQGLFGKGITLNMILFWIFKDWNVFFRYFRLRSGCKWLTHSHTITPFDAPGKQAFWKHCGKRRYCSWRAISAFPTVFSTHLDNFLPFSSNLKLSSANSFSLEV